MLKSLLLFAALCFAQSPDAGKPPELSSVAGVVIGPDGTNVNQPVQVLLLSPKYANYFSTDVQTRVDTYWERYKAAFAQKKEVFLEVSKMAYKESIQLVHSRMRRELGPELAKYVVLTDGGKFEFKDIPLGDYKLLARVTLQGQELIWQESIQLTSSVPEFIQVKKRIP